MTSWDKHYQPVFDLRDLIDASEELGPKREIFTSTHWDAWKRLHHPRDVTLEKYVQTEPCIWKETELAVLRQCKLNMNKRVQQLERECTDQRQRIDELQRRCIAQNMLVARLTKLAKRPNQVSHTIEEKAVGMTELGRMDQLEVENQDLRETVMKLETENITLKQQMKVTNACVRSMVKQISQDRAHVPALEALLKSEEMRTMQKNQQYRILWRLFEKLLRHLDTGSILTTDENIPVYWPSVPFQ